ncbi:MAG: fibrobacter succinogenes major paralogous domain-containing protein, partial [Dysgonamonadaceae bacterium]|nr:fibrobacter succinogenes major paralogous domain-containing protein [Dysgonamonadaceae bacterium]
KDGTELLSDPAAPEPLLFLPAGGYRNYRDVSVHDAGSDGNYWSSVVDGTGSYYMYFGSSSVRADYPDDRAYGSSVRCVAAE